MDCGTPDIHYSAMALYSVTWEIIHESALYIPDMALLNTHTL
jgi:hypothetical protein